jgi:hypothetical protein
VLGMVLDCFLKHRASAASVEFYILFRINSVLKGLRYQTENYYHIATHTITELLLLMA